MGGRGQCRPPKLKLGPQNYFPGADAAYLYRVGPAIRSSIKTINDKGHSQDPWGIPPMRVVQDE